MANSGTTRLDDVAFQLDGGEFRSIIAEPRLTYVIPSGVLRLGWHNVLVKAVDNAGNAAIASVVFNVEHERAHYALKPNDLLEY